MEIILDLIIVFLSTFIGFVFGRYSLKDEIHFLKMEKESSYKTINSLVFKINELKEKNEGLQNFIKTHSFTKLN